MRDEFYNIHIFMSDLTLPTSEIKGITNGTLGRKVKLLNQLYSLSMIRKKTVISKHHVNLNDYKMFGERS